jgi:hypothetical protein
MVIKKGQSGGDFEPHPETESLVKAVIVDVTPPKERQRVWEGKTSNITEVKVVYETEVEDDEGKRFCLWSRGYRVDGKDPLHEKSNLRRDLKSILGRDLTAKELEGFDLEMLLGKSVRVMVEHETNERGTFARITLLKAAKDGEELKPSGSYVRVKDREQKDANYSKAGAAPAPAETGGAAAGGGWESTKVHLEGYNGLPLCDLDLETIEKLVKEELPKLEAKEKKSIADKRLIAALTEAAKEI